MFDICIRRAKTADANDLTHISFESKGHWNYPQEYFTIWKDELTISESYIQNNMVFVAEADGQIVGYYSIVECGNDFWAGKVFVMKGFWLEHIFILPEFIGRGIGSTLIRHAMDLCKSIRCDKLYIFSDPNARGFYDKLGATYIKESPSSIEGRTVTLYELHVGLKAGEV